MPSRHRLTRTELTQAQKAKSKRYFGTYCTIAVYGITPKPLKCTITVSKKISKKAVERNKLKRLYRELVRKELSNLPSGTLVLFPKKEALQARFEDLAQDFNHTLGGLAKNRS